MKRSLLMLSLASLSLLITSCNNKKEEEEEKYNIVTKDSIKYLTYDGDEKVAMVIGYEENLASEISIPDNINGYEVNAIRHESFVDSSISKITIPESVVYLGYRSFAKCYNLKEISIPNSIETIYQNTFALCSSLETITIPESVKEIKTGAFIGCNALKNITLSKNLETIGSYTFTECTSLNNIDLSITKIEEIPEYCFAFCSSLSDVTLGNVTSLNEGAFYTSSISKIILPDSLNLISSYTFYDCNNLKEIFIPKEVVYIGKNVFTGCNDDLKILLESEDISSYFSDNFNCYYPYSLGATKDTLSSNVFIDDTSYNYAINNNKSDNPTATLLSESNEEISAVNVPANVTFTGGKKDTANITKIGNYAFLENKTIQSLDLNKATNLTEIGNYSFYGSTLKEVVFNQNITSLGKYSFGDCEEFESLDLSDTKLEYINEGCFEKNYKNTKILLPTTVKYIGYGAFYKCKNLEQIVNLSSITNELNLEGETFAYCYSLGKNENSPFVFTSNIKTITLTDFYDWGTLNNQYIKISKDAYTKDENGDVYLNCNDGIIKLTTDDEGETYKNKLYFSNAIITLESQS